MERKALLWVGRVALIGAGLVCGAAGAQVGVTEGVAPLMPQGGPPAALIQRVMAQGGSFQAAPVPNPDAAAPAEIRHAEASVEPKFISPRSLFQGDGFATGSSEEASLDGRRQAAAGLGLSVPLEDEK